MRIQITTLPNTQPVPFDYQQKLVGALHKWIGQNNLHGEMSLYSFSWLQNGCKNGNALDFKHGAKFSISFYDDSVLKSIIHSIQSEPDLFCGMKVKEIMLVNAFDIQERDLFFCASPIFIKRKLKDGTIKQYSFNDAETSKLMAETLNAKMLKAGLEADNTLDIRFDLTYAKKKQKLVRYHNIGNKANICPVIIKGKPETKLFAWNVGIGSCTGIGFGAIY